MGLTNRRINVSSKCCTSNMSYATEKYKGVGIKYVANIVGNKKQVTATFKVKAKLYNATAITKGAATDKAKQIINRIL